MGNQLKKIKDWGLGFFKTEEIKPKDKRYNLHDFIIIDKNIEENIKFRVLLNEKGKFVDIRRYYGPFPMIEGVRMNIEVFMKMFEELEVFLCEKPTKKRKKLNN